MFLQYAGDILKLTGISKAQVKLCRRERPRWLGIGCRSAGDLSLMKPALERLRQEEKGVLPLLKLVPMSALDNLLAEGAVVGVDAQGRLVLRSESGIETAISSGEAHLV